MGQPSPLSRCVVNLHRLSSVGDPNMSHEVRPSFLLVYYLILEMYLVNLIYFSQIKKTFPPLTHTFDKMNSSLLILPRDE